jgi:lysophospholipase L1-like esterase
MASWHVRASSEGFRDEAHSTFVARTPADARLHADIAPWRARQRHRVSDLAWARCAAILLLAVPVGCGGRGPDLGGAGSAGQGGRDSGGAGGPAAGGGPGQAGSGGQAGMGAAMGGSGVAGASGAAGSSDAGSGGIGIGGAGQGGVGTGGGAGGGAAGSLGLGGRGGASGSSAGTSGVGGGPRDAGADAARDSDASQPGDAGASADGNQGALVSVTLHLAGDSTVMTYAAPTATADEGWGQELGQYLIAKVVIDNQAVGGASVVSFHDSSRWTNIINATRSGDYVMAAFGANDSGSVAGRHVEPAAFQAMFERMADEVKAKGATFIPVTPSALREFTGAVEGNVRLGPYAAAIIAAGKTKNLLVDDLNARSVELLNMIGPSGAMLLYKGSDKAHFTKAGATKMAQFVADELRRVGSPLAAYLK